MGLSRVGLTLGFPHFGSAHSLQVETFLADRLLDKSLLFLKDIIKFYLVYNTFIVSETLFWFYNTIMMLLNTSLNLRNDFSLGHPGSVALSLARSLESSSSKHVIFLNSAIRYLDDFQVYYEIVFKKTFTTSRSISR